MQQRGEQDRRLLTLEEELKKLESKLLVAVREKTGLAANVASLERQLAELKKANEFLKTKVTSLSVFPSLCFLSKRLHINRFTEECLGTLIFTGLCRYHQEEDQCSFHGAH